MWKFWVDRQEDLRDDTHMTSMKIVQFSRPPTPFSIYVQNSSTFLNSDVQFQTTPLSKWEPINWKKTQSKDDYYMLSGPSFKSSFVFSINPLILTGFPLTSFHLAEASLLYFLLHGFTILCVQLSENIEKCLLFIIIHIFSTNFANNLFHLHNLKT